MAAKKKSKKKAKKTKAVTARKTAGARRVVKAKKSKSQKAKKAARPAKARKAIKAKKTVKAKRPAKRAKRASPLEGEGSYTAARNYDEEQREFVAENKGKISKMAHDAETALEGREGDNGRKPEAEGGAKARA